MTKKISIITIAYNNYKGLVSTFNSIQSQTALNAIEWIVIDGLSTDNTVNWLKTNKTKIDFLVSEKDTGIYNAMNKGLAIATTSYVWFMNSGDALFETTTVEKWLAVENSNTQLYYSDTMFMDLEGNNIGLISKLKPQRFPKNLQTSSFKFGMSICHQSIIISKAIAPVYNEKYRLSSDIDWIIKILKQNPKTRNCDFILSKFEVGGASYNQQKAAWKERFFIMSNHYGFVFNVFAHFYISLRAIWFKFFK